MGKPKADLGTIAEVRFKAGSRPRVSPLPEITESMPPEVADMIRNASADLGRQFFDSVPREYLAAIGRKGGLVGGSISTPSKRRAARENGKLGGRPKGSKNKP
jgi:general stress protein YciG